MASLNCPRTTCLRAAAQSSRTFAAPFAPMASFTSSARPLKQLRLSHEPTRSIPAISARKPATCSVLSGAPATRRNASTETLQQPAKTPTEMLTWDRFFELRKKKRYLQLVAQIFTGTASFLIAAPLITEYEVDAYLAQLTGLDPVIMLGMTAVAVAVGGGMCGPTFSNAAFKMWAKSKGLDRAIAEKEKSFFARVKRYRADPSRGSPQNPVPDYYGEKISSVKGYRSWLKDQRAFNRKKDRPLGF